MTTTDPQQDLKVQLRNKINSHVEQLLDNFSNLIKSAKVVDPDILPSTNRSNGGGAPPAHGDMMTVYTEKVQHSCRELLNITQTLKKNAVLNDFRGRNSEMQEEGVGGKKSCFDG
jgi:hypothetical protein